MNEIVKLVAVVVAGIAFTACDNSTAQNNSKATPQLTGSAKEIRGATPYIELRDEPPPKLIVDPPLPDLLDQGVVWIQWRVENVHIAPVFGKGALQTSPRLGHLHVQVDDLPWWWADPSDINTIDLAGLPPGPHKILITLVDANHEPFPGQSKLVTFTVGGNSKTPSAVQSTDKKVASCG
ncbi:DUF6130 family protein [Terrimonas alba]|uniref:DUF6130 family protein n=1 Tax=Terrimonas alba TaxID=3349636 RepID=UPI0035F48D7B